MTFLTFRSNYGKKWQKKHGRRKKFLGFQTSRQSALDKGKVVVRISNMLLFLSVSPQIWGFPYTFLYGLLHQNIHEIPPSVNYRGHLKMRDGVGFSFASGFIIWKFFTLDSQSLSKSEYTPKMDG